MLIKIDESVVSDLESITQKEIEALEYISLAMREGKHIVIAEYNTLKKLIKLVQLSDNCRKVYNNILKRYAIIKGIEKYVNGYILVVSGDNLILRTEYENKIVYNVSLDYFNDSEKILPLHIVSEDESDCKFYESIARKYIKEKEYGINLNIRCIHGGGDKTAEIYNRELLEYKRICLTIADSDKKYPTCSEGKTARGIRNIYNLNKNNNITEIHILNVREKENLIPPDIYMMCTKSSNSKKDLQILKDIYDNDILKNLYLFGDIKDGIRTDDIFELKEVCCTVLEEDIIKKSMNQKHKITNGIGYMLSNVEKEILCGKLKDVINEKKKVLDRNKDNVGLKNEIIKLNEIYLRANNLFDTISPDIKKEWEEISGKILTFACCISQFMA